MKKPVLKAIAVIVLVVGVPSALWIWGALRPSAPEEADGVGEADGAGEAGRSGLQAALSPLARGAAGAARVVSRGLTFLVTSDNVRRRNAVLEQENARLSAENAALREAIAQYERLDATATLAETQGWKVISADVIAYGTRRWTRSLLVNRGAKHGIEPRDPVIHCLGGLAGSVLKTGPRTSTIQLLSDPQAAIGVLVLPVRAHGVVRGTGGAGNLEVTLENPDIPLRPGQRVVTSGMRNSLYPRGLLVGTVSGLKKNRFGQSVGEVEPAVVFGQMEEVLVLKTGQSSGTGEPPDIERPAGGTVGERLPQASGERVAPGGASSRETQSPSPTDKP
ncbi:MAG TPA: rod shape-determining protein MreC [Sumerlaeia bacterium]|nr:rod shape-determining protein MreC [Sumerlaeia bacterium]